MGDVGTCQGVLFVGSIFPELNVHSASVAKPGIDSAVLFGRVPHPGPVIDPGAISRLMAEMRALHDAMASPGVTIPGEAVAENKRFRDGVAARLATSPHEQ